MSKPKGCGWRFLPELIQDVRDFAAAEGLSVNAAATVLLREGLHSIASRRGGVDNTAARRYRK